MRFSNKHKFSFFPIRWMLIPYDLLIFATVIVFALVLYQQHLLEPIQILWHFLTGSVCIVTSRFFLRAYGQIWRYGGVTSYIRIMAADTCALIVYFIFQRFVPGVGDLPFVIVALIVFTNSLISLACRMVYRLTYKKLNRTTKFGKFVTKMVNIFGRCNWTINDKGDPVEKIKIAIVGAGVVGTALAEELGNNPHSVYKAVCFVDNDPEKLGREIYGKEVIMENDNAPEILKDFGVQEVVLALPSYVEGDERKRLYERYKHAGFKVKSYDYPSMQNTQKGKRTLREFDIEDLLFRKEQEVITDATINYYKEKVILVTGGGGSIGSEIARQLAKMEPKQLILLDIYENGVYDIQQELRIQYGNKLDLQVEICSITNK